MTSIRDAAAVAALPPHRPGSGAQDRHRAPARLLAELAGSPAWVSQALCVGADPELWFPARGNPRGRARAAKRICLACPVRTECLGWALERRELHGIWGGLAVRERRRLLRRAAATARAGGG